MTILTEYLSSCVVVPSQELRHLSSRQLQLNQEIQARTRALEEQVGRGVCCCTGLPLYSVM